MKLTTKTIFSQLLAILFLLIFSQFSLIHAQNSDTTRVNYGLSSFLNYNIHTANFNKLPGVPNCCPNFESGSGLGLAFGLYYELPIAKKISIGANLNYSTLGGLLEVDEIIPIRIGNELIDGVSTHYLDTRLGYVEINPYGLYQYKDFSFKLGVSLAMNINANYDQKEEITNPNNRGVFVDEETGESTGRRRNVFENSTLSDMNPLLMGINIGIGYDLLLKQDKSLMITPNVNFNYRFNNVHSNLDWTINTISAGISVRYFPKPDIYVPKDVFKIDTLIKKKDYIKRRFVSKGIDLIREYKYKSVDTIYIITEFIRTDTLYKVGIDAKFDPSKPIKKYRYKNTHLTLIAKDEHENELKLDSLYLKVEITREIYPLLPYVFFEENSSLIPTRYKRIFNPSNFDATALEPSPITYHRNNLNIIGQRMLANQSANITAIGYIDPTTEKNKCDLALERALAVKNYLVKTFKIEANRIEAKVDSKSCSPLDLTKSKTRKAYQENRRVVISTKSPGFLFAVNRAKVQEPTEIYPPIIEVKGLGEIYVTKYDPYEPYNKKKQDYEIEQPSFNEVNIHQEGYPIFNQTYSGTNVNEVIKFTRQNIQNLKDGSPIEFYFKTHDINNSFEEKRINIDVRKDTAQIAVEKLTLTIFQVSQSTLDNRIKKEIKKFLSNLDEKSEILIKGYSDNLGDYNSNKNLSAYRAKEVKNYINMVAPRAKVVSVKGVGSDEFPPGVYSYKTPEERFISRTVEIEVRTIIK